MAGGGGPAKVGKAVLMMQEAGNILYRAGIYRTQRIILYFFLFPGSDNIASFPLAGDGINSTETTEIGASAS